ncbi:MAG: gas vesicle protein K [Chloroflexi bacterium]|nr:gas vesicle protein K [Chloroflexota bacterium]
MILELSEGDLKSGVLSLVVALVEIIREALRLQAVKRMEGGSLTEREVERLGEALTDLDAAIEKLKVEMGIAESVKSVRDGLDSLVDDLLDTMLAPRRWAQEAQPVP